jgi:signal transduction histidine kinase
MSVNERRKLDKLRFNQEQFLFLRTMGHELRSPLNSILATSEMMVGNVYGELPPKQLKAAQRILRNSNRLVDLVSATMLYIRAEANALELSSLPIALRELLNQSIAAKRDGAAAKGLNLELVIQPETIQNIQGDPDQIAFIVNELINNAIVFTQSGTIQLQVGSSNANHWTLSVTDTGVGIEPDNLYNVYTPFWRGKDIKQYTEDGNGLGLTIVREFVRLMAGTIDIHSQVGKGTTVKLTLPTNCPCMP